MSDNTPLTIPADLLPSDGRFGAGPSKVRPEQVAGLAAVTTSFLGTSHRQKTVRNEVARVRQGLRSLFSLPDDYEVVLGNGGSTAFWEVAAFGLVRDRAQFLTFGEFGSKFASSVSDAPFLGTPTIHTSDPGSAPQFTAEAGVDAYATPHNETSTGVAITPQRVSGADEGALMLIDATSAAGGLAVDPAEFDVYYFAPQKCFGSDGGLWFALMSPTAIERAVEIKESSRYIPAFLDLQTAIDNSRLEQTYNTPALATIFMMGEQLDWFNSNGGLDWCVRRTRDSSEVLYGWADRTSYTILRCVRRSLAPSTSTTPSTPPRWPSNCAPTASLTSSLTASWVATSCGWRCSRPLSPVMLKHSPTASTTSWPISGEPHRGDEADARSRHARHLRPTRNLRLVPLRVWPERSVAAR